MHRSKIDWADDTWNPITGCLKECEYCYARKKSVRFSGDIRLNMASSQYIKEGECFILDSPFVAETGGILNYPFGYRPTYHKYRLDYPAGRKNGCNILVSEWGELFGEWVPEEWIKNVIDSCIKYPEHKYLFLTKNPTRYIELFEKGILPVEKNFWYGISVIDSLNPFPELPLGANTYICIEPIRNEINLPKNIINSVKWIIIGAESGNGRSKVIPKKQWIIEIAESASESGVPVFMKESLRPIMDQDIKQDYPAELLDRKISPKVLERLEGNCCCCKERMRKNKMIALSARSERGEQPKQFAHICKPCFCKKCVSLGIQIPELRAFKE